MIKPDVLDVVSERCGNEFFCRTFFFLFCSGELLYFNFSNSSTDFLGNGFFVLNF